MKYTFHDFYRWEGPLKEELEKRGYFVYGLRDQEGTHYDIERNVIVNNIGYLVTDNALPLHDGYMSDTEFEALGGQDDNTISEGIKRVAEDISDILNEAKKEYDNREAEREKEWKEVLRIQDNRLERDRHYRLSLRKDNPYNLPDGKSIRFQTIYDNGDGTQKVMYFICGSTGKITVDSTTLNTKYNCRYLTMVKAVANAHGLAV